MQGKSIKHVFLALILASALPLVACSDDDNPTSPTEPGPPVGEQPTPPAPEPEPPTPEPPDDDDDDDVPTITLTGQVANLNRSGAGDLDIDFRIDRETIVRAAGGTPVISGSATFNTDAVRNGQTVIVQGRRNNGFLDATRIEITQQAP